jgi:hypothetical protein
MGRPQERPSFDRLQDGGGPDGDTPRGARSLGHQRVSTMWVARSVGTVSITR